MIQRLRSADTCFVAGGYTFAIVYALFIIIPLYFVFISSFKENTEIFSAPLSLPETWSLAKYALAQERVNIVRAMGVSFLITTGAEALTLLLSFMAAYAIARFRIPEARWMEMGFGMGFLIPVFAVLVPVFLLAAKTGLLYNPLFLVMFYAASRLPLTIMVLASNMREIPRELEECAVIDGANVVQTMRHVFFPLVRSGIATVLILNFLYVWNEYLFALILLSQKTRTVQLVIPLLKSERLVDYGLVSAGIIISLLPPYLIFMFFQERVMKGMMGGAVKG